MRSHAMFLLALAVACGPDEVKPGDDTGSPGSSADDTSAGEDTSGCDELNWYADADGDGFGTGNVAVSSCEGGEGLADNADDCDDADALAHPDAAEIWYDGIDQDCAEGDDFDADGDGYDASAYGGEDCDDADPQAWPGAEERWYDGVDGDCSGGSDFDADGDGAERDHGDCDEADPTEPVWVSTSGSSSGAGTFDDPLDTIQGGMELAHSCVLVDAGTYGEAIDFAGKDLVVTGLAGAELTVIDGTDLGAVVTLAGGETATLSGFTITGGTGTCADEACAAGVAGAGIYASGATVTLRDLFITLNSAEAGPTISRGGGLAVLDGAAVSVVSTWLFENSADLGGGAYVDSTSALDLVQTWVAGNLAGTGAALWTEGAVTGSNVIVVGHESTAGNGADVAVVGGDLALMHATLVGNDAAGGSLRAGEAGSASLVDSIFFDNDNGPLIDADEGGTVSVEYCDVYMAAADPYGSGVADPTGTAGNISQDPILTAWSDNGYLSDDDFHLRPSSPCVDAGTGPGDVDGSAADMGAYGGPNGTPPQSAPML